MAKNENSGEKLVYLILLGVGAVVMFRFLMAFQWLIVSAFMLTAAFFLVYRTWKYFSDQKKKEAWAESLEGRIEEQTIWFQSKLSNLEKEVSDIERNIRDLENHLSQRLNIDSAAMAETGQLIQSFKEEKAVRIAKIEFFKSALFKLNSILQGHLLTQQIEEKKEKLKRLREENYASDSDLDLQNSKEDFDRFILNKMDDLATEILDVHNISEVEKLRGTLNEE